MGHLILSVEHRQARGFTLIEVLVALAVLAVVMASIARSTSQTAMTTLDLQQQTLAGWVAANVIEQVRLRDPWPVVGRRQGQTIMGRDQWYWQLEIKGTEEPRMRRLEVVVYADTRREQPIASLTGFIGRGTGP